MGKQKKLTLSRARELVKQALGVSPAKLKREHDNPGYYEMFIGKIYVEVGECYELSGFRSEDYYQVQIGFFTTCDFVITLYDKKTLERNEPAEEEYRKQREMLATREEESV